MTINYSAIYDTRDLPITGMYCIGNVMMHSYLMEASNYILPYVLNSYMRFTYAQKAFIEYKLDEITTIK